MTEKRYYAHKHLLHENEVHDKRCHNFMSLDETVEHLNNEYWKYKQLKDENEVLKAENTGLKKDLQETMDIFKELTESNLFENDEDKEHYMRWVNQIKEYLTKTNKDFEYNTDFIIKIALSYTLQSLRNGESLKRFQWEYK